MMYPCVKAIVFLAVLALSACGGSGGCGGAGIVFGKAAENACESGDAAGTTEAATSYVAVANIGELVEWKVVWGATPPRYSYSIIESAYGLEGQSNSGTLKLNADGTYVPSNIPGGLVVRSPDGTLAAQIYVKKPGAQASQLVDVVGIPPAGVAQANPLVGGVYNYIGSKCAGGACSSHYGTLKFSSDRWEVCPNG